MTIIEELEQYISTLEPCPRLQYLEKICLAIKTGQLQLINHVTDSNHTKLVYEYLSQKLHTTPIPDNYFEWSVQDLLNHQHPLMRDDMTLYLVKILGPMTREEARLQHTVQEYTDEQFETLWNQMSIWVAMHEPRPSKALN